MAATASKHEPHAVSYEWSKDEITTLGLGYGKIGDGLLAKLLWAVSPYPLDFPVRSIGAMRAKARKLGIERQPLADVQGRLQLVKDMPISLSVEARMKLAAYIAIELEVETSQEKTRRLEASASGKKPTAPDRPDGYFQCIVCQKTEKPRLASCVLWDSRKGGRSYATICSECAYALENNATLERFSDGEY